MDSNTKSHESELVLINLNHIPSVFTAFTFCAIHCKQITQCNLMSLPMNVNGDSDIVLMILMFVHLFLVLSWKKKLNMFFFKERKWKHLYFNLGFISSIHIISWTCYYKCLSIFANVCPFLHNTVFQYFHLSTRNSPIGIKRSFLSNPLHHLLFCNVILFFVFFLYFSKENNKNKMMQNSLFHILQIHKDFYTFLF